MTTDTTPVATTHAVPSDEATEFLQQRLAVSGRVGCILSLGFYAVVNGLALVGTQGVRPGVLLSTANLAVLAVALIYATLWWIGRGPRRPRGLLRAADVAGTLAAALGCAAHAWLGGELAAYKFNALLATTNILIFRAILLPSAPRRTAWIGALACLPSLVPAWLFWLRPGWSAVAVSQVEVAFFTGWCLVAVAISVVVSSVVYGLQRSVREARRLGQYNLEEKIGEGGMGDVYQASHALLRRPTAIKLLRPEKAGEDSIARFEREVQSTARLTHPNTVAIYDYGRTPDGIFYYAMEYLPGLDLEKLVLTHGPMSPGRVIHVLEQVCGSLAEAHDQELIHRDIKAANVILCQRGGIADVVKVVDFGLVKEVSAAAAGQEHATNVIRGTTGYMAPEAIRTPHGVDARTDLYAVGVLGYYLLTGTHPFESHLPEEVLAHHLFREPDPPAERIEQPLPDDLQQVVLACMAKDPGERPQGARELAAGLAACAAHGSWTPEDARRWWDGSRGHDRADEPKRTTLVQGGRARTVEVDFTARVGDIPVRTGAGEPDG